LTEAKAKPSEKPLPATLRQNQRRNQRLVKECERLGI
jgi:hypothetical protein